MITYDQIAEVNKGLEGIDVKGKQYVIVPQRVKAFRKLFPEGFIRTELLSLNEGVCVMQTKVGYYEDGKEVILGTGMAYEKESSSFINKTSFIENCETSAVGRALGFLALGIDGGGICSAEELANAINNQNKPKQINNKEEAEKIPGKNIAGVTTVSKLPNTNPVKDYIANEMNLMSEMFGIQDKDQMLMRFMAMRNSLIEAKIIEDIPSDKQTMEQAKVMIDAMYKNFRPSGDKA